MSRWIRALVPVAGLAGLLVVSPGASAQGLVASSPYLRSEWGVEARSAGRAHVVGYLYNSRVQDAANVIEDFADLRGGFVNLCPLLRPR